MTSIRKIGSTNIVNPMVVQQPLPGTEAAIEGDSNADTCCLGKNFVILEYTTKQVDVYAYDKSIKPLENVPIVFGATAWTDPATGNTIDDIF